MFKSSERQQSEELPTVQSHIVIQHKKRYFFTIFEIEKRVFERFKNGQTTTF